MRTIHQIPRLHFSQMMKKSQIKEKLLKIDNLNDLYEIVKNKDWEEGSYLKSTDLYNLEDLEYWTDSSIYEELRKPVYLNVYNKIIKKK